LCQLRELVVDVVERFARVQPLLLEAAVDVEGLAGKMLLDRVLVALLLFLGGELGCCLLLHGDFLLGASTDDGWWHRRADWWVWRRPEGWRTGWWLGFERG
jgi:hypothetical protein